MAAPATLDTLSSAVGLPERTLIIDFGDQEVPRWVIVWQEDDDGRVTRGIAWAPVEHITGRLGRVSLPPDLTILPLYHKFKVEVPPDGINPLKG